MSFGFFVPITTPTSARTKRSTHIPIATMQKMGCTACPRNSDTNLIHPVMEPNGPMGADLLVLHGSPRTEDDSAAGCGYSDAQSFVARLVRYYDPGPFIQHAIVQCATHDANPYMDANPAQAETECCRGYIEDVIVRAKPRLIVGVGDAPLAWIKGMLTGTGKQIKAAASRGTLIACRIAGHDCWYMPVMFPQFLENRGRSSRKSEFEWALEHDLKRACDLVNNPNFGPPSIIEPSEYAEGIEVVLGDKPSDIPRIEAFLEWAAAELESGCDFETNGLRPYLIRGLDGKGNPLLLTAAVGTFDRVLAFPVMHPAGWPSEYMRKRVMSALGQYLLKANRVLGHNIAFEMEWTNFWFGDWPLRMHEWEDTMSMAHSMDERRGTKSLGALTRVHFGFNVKLLSNVDTANIINYPLPTVLLYNGMDTKWTCALAMALRSELYAPGMEWAVNEYERKLRLAPTLVTTTSKGMLVDQSKALAHQHELEARQKKIVALIARCPEVVVYTRRFGTFEPGNVGHVLTLMKTVCQRPEVRREDWKGNVKYTTDDDALSAIPEDEVPSAALILEYRGNDKLLGTYVRKITGMDADGKQGISPIVCDDGCVRTNYSSHTAVTGRLASDDPNLQNIPIRTEEGRRVRQSFVAPPGYLFCAADYGQIEARVIGMLSEDDNLLRYQWTDYDIHAFWAQRMLDLHPEVKDWIVKSLKIDWDEKGFKALRQEAKNKWVFPKFFGATSDSCADGLHLPYDVTNQMEAELWDDFKGVLKWQERLIKGFEKNLYVEVMGGPRRTGPMTRNEIINTPVQGTACMIVTAAMCELSEKAFIEDQPEFQPNLNVHDDLSTMLRIDTLDATLDEYAKIMCRPRFDWMIVPIIVETKVGPNWQELKHHKDYRSDVLYNQPNPYK